MPPDIADDATFDVTLAGEGQVVIGREDLEKLLAAYLAEHDGDVQAFAGVRIVLVPESGGSRAVSGRELPWSDFVEIAPS